MMKDIPVTRKIIFAVDDDPVLLELTQTILERADMVVVTFLTGEDMLFRIHHQVPDLILLDIEISEGMDGFETCKHLKSNDAFKDIPVIFLSGASDIENKVKGFKVGAKDYISKPVLPREMIARVKTHLLSSQLEKDLKKSEEKYKSMMEAMTDSVYIISSQGVVEYMNPVMIQRILEDVVGKICYKVFQGLSQPCAWCELGKATGCSTTGAHFVSPKDQRRYHMTHMPVYRDNGKTSTMVIMRDETDYFKALEAKEKSEHELMQAQKMKSIGQLAAGIAHEINTPIQYIRSNTDFLKTAFSELIAIGKVAQDLLDAVKSGNIQQELVGKAEKILEEGDLEYQTEEIPLAVQQSIDGANQIAAIVQSMKEFSRTSGEMVPIDINHALENTITISRSEWKYVSKTICEFDELLPHVLCRPGEINQVFLNLITNASQAIKEIIGEDPKVKGEIRIKTESIDNWVRIIIKDTGIGISKENQNHIFDPFFTTKEVGQGTGQGLAIAYNMIVIKHKGKLQCESEPGKGATFVISLPLS